MSIGPGLGRDLRLIDGWGELLQSLNQKQVVCDADFFWYFTQSIFASLKTMKAGKGYVFTPNKREFVKIFSFLNKKTFDFSGIDWFLEALEAAVTRIESGSGESQEVEFALGGDSPGEGVFSLENLGDAEKSFAQLLEQKKEFSKGILGNETIKIHSIGALVSVN